MTSLEQLKTRMAEIQAISRRHGVTLIRLFGSAARGEDDAASDIDLLVEMEPGRSLMDLGGFQMDMQDLLGRRVDVVTEAGLRRRLRERILREAVALEG